jgi:hypothetical protein
LKKKNIPAEISQGNQGWSPDYLPWSSFSVEIPSVYDDMTAPISAVERQIV